MKTYTVLINNDITILLNDNLSNEKLNLIYLNIENLLKPGTTTKIADTDIVSSSIEESEVDSAIDEPGDVDESLYEDNEFQIDMDKIITEEYEQKENLSDWEKRKNKRRNT